MKLSEVQFGLLLWLANGNSLEVCNDIGAYQGKTNGLQFFNGRSCKRTMQRLENEKFIYTTNVYHYGVSWLRYYISETGLAFIDASFDNKKQGYQHG